MTSDSNEITRNIAAELTEFMAGIAPDLWHDSAAWRQTIAMLARMMELSLADAEENIRRDALAKKLAMKENLLTAAKLSLNDIERINNMIGTIRQGRSDHPG